MDLVIPLVLLQKSYVQKALRDARALDETAWTNFDHDGVKQRNMFHKTTRPVSYYMTWPNPTMNDKVFISFTSHYRYSEVVKKLS